ncbi:Tetratricopeptide repeat-containing protein [Rhizobiales bacterium GAS191]|jgi:Tfp pilus assembly protein PilF|nr:Tetratricopeptide repeat-containing protein [Rhizobiales bacterium GAS113]SEC54388.1 Tetratricopeptide repeat-containing protein [Rhizobiales bacterium GAS188]SEC73585.1 Tetratricopeptide repeat-containing protein [Rhizobiales bacterium GAS191]
MHEPSDPTAKGADDIAAARAAERVARGRSLVAASLLAFGLAACQTSDPGQAPAAAVEVPEASLPATNATVEQPAEVKYFPSDEPLRLGIEHFKQGNYGMAQRYFRDAVERAPRDATAWIGLAASYDRIGRFDLADRAYHSAIKLTGETTQILNNEGYSYMLRGDLSKARAKFLSAYRREPDNPAITNNLSLLDASSKYIQRRPE